MIRCADCGYVGEYTNAVCPDCHKRFRFSEKELAEKKREIKMAKEAKSFDLMVEGYHVLADQGELEYMREYASMLEKGELVQRDLDAAEKYFADAAKKNDAYSAFRYARLVERTSRIAADFWLPFAAVLGCVESYPVLADKLSCEGKEDEANYFYALAASCEQPDAIVTMAKRYYNGIGVDKNESYAKWYLDRLFLPPFHAVKMAYKLRAVKGENPGVPAHPNYDKFLRRLAITAHDLDYEAAYHKLCSIMSERGDLKARMILGMLYADGIGCTQNTSMALAMLSDAAAHGNADAYRRMGEIYLTGNLLPADANKALSCYQEAAKLGMPNAYESIGDIYEQGKLVPKSITTAIEYYDMAAKDGVASARTKAEALRTRREDLCNRARAIVQFNPEEAFRCYAISTGMGYLPAYAALGRCFEHGIGTKKDRARAFLWYKKAVDSGDSIALTPLGMCYARGIGTAFNFKMAVKTLGRASRQGSLEAERELKRLLENKKRNLTRRVYSHGMRLIYMHKFSEAERVLITCLKAQHPEGIYTLGCMHEFGLGVPTSRELAFKLYEQAYELGYRDPRSTYKLTVLKMTKKKK